MKSTVQLENEEKSFKNIEVKLVFEGQNELDVFYAVLNNYKISEFLKTYCTNIDDLLCNFSNKGAYNSALEDEFFDIVS